MKHWRTYLKYTITLALTCVVVGGALGAVNYVTDPIISARKLAAADSSRLLLFPDADKFEPMEVIEGSGMDNAYTALKGGETIGHVGQATVSGSQGMIDVISGIDSGGKVVGVIVGSSTFSETNGIGSKTKEPDFTDQFIGLELPAKPGQNVDTITGATISSTAVINATNLIGTYLQDPSAAPSGAVTVSAAPPRAAQVVKTGTAVKVTTAAEWAQQYPDIYASYLANSENDSVHDYVADYPMLSKVYEGMAFNKYYSSARGHVYTIEDVTETGRPHALANCFSCKTPDFTAKVNELGDAAYRISFEDMQAQVNEPISCYNCHANTPGELVVTHTYLSDAMGRDLMKVDAENLSCGQCHVEYYFNPATKATSLPYTSLETMAPDAILSYYNDTSVEGQPFADYTNPRTGVRQIKVQHPEFETFMGPGSQHAGDYTCADCHMGQAVNAQGETYVSHTWTSPLDNQALIDSTCSACHADLRKETEELQEAMERRTYAVGYELERLTDTLAEAVESGAYTEAQLDEIRELARSAQFYWDFVFVENSEGAHNSKLNNECLDKAEDYFNQAMVLLH
ncbi:ammonia-forming cytochrome c nitrite reductase subunit c552 [uncultured Oscillibacter sp.]|uniref:ammonia-forming cytochrome c nitrite reductase subunit c552 n=1 Tax=uncultured Oscillibacter sp. TaxID=876091 RepID=UPI00262C2E61|nr:ammonia-forming cytochrome c nitrite reductase subunit c552 [uncultured Oscillibacter sp.]